MDSKLMGFRFLEDDFIEFFCTPEYFLDYVDGEDVYVSGTFNGWINSADSAWKMQKKLSKSKVIFSLQKKFSDVNIPGNTGFPEFKFYALSETAYHKYKENLEGVENYFNTNRLVLRTKDDFKEIADLNVRPGFVKSLDDFDLDCPACRSDLSNVRLVPGTKCLLRGYNPFKRSKDEFNTENVRLELTQKAFELYDVKCDITLNGYEGAIASAGEVMPDVIKKIEDAGNRLCINIDYNLVYFHSDAVDYSVALRKIAMFIIERAGPYYIHCRLGSDRTGVTCAVLAALCGASWKDIAADYERTSNMGIAEYRNRRLLQYSLKKMLCADPANLKDLAHSIQSYFIKENILTADEIKKLISKLNADMQKKEIDFFDFSENHICAKKNAKVK